MKMSLGSIFVMRCVLGQGNVMRRRDKQIVIDRRTSARTFQLSDDEDGTADPDTVESIERIGTDDFCFAKSAMLQLPSI